MGRWLQWLDIRPHEKGLVGLLLAHSACLGGVRVAAETAANTLFVQRYGAAWLPLTFIGAALANPLVSLAYDRLGRALAFRHLCGLCLACLAIATLACRWLLEIQAAWPALVLMIFFHSLYLVTGLEFWGLCGRLLDLRQAKRLLGLIGTGELAAQMCLGLSIPLFVRFTSTANLLYLSLAGLMVCLLIVRILSRVPSISSDGDGEEAAPRPGELLGDGYIRLLLAAAAGYTLCSYLIYQMFFDVASLRYADEARLAGFVGLYQAVAGGLALLMGSLATSQFLDRFGLAGGLLCFPSGVVATGVLVSLSYGLGGPVVLTFALVVLLKLQDDTIFDTLYRPAYQTLRQPLPPERRVGVQTAAEGWVEPVVGGVAGLVLLGLTQGLHLQVGWQAALLVGLGLLWWLGCRRLAGDYPRVLLHSLARRQLSLTPENPGPYLRRRPSLPGHSGSVRVLADALNSSHPGELLYLLKLMREVSLPVWERGLLQHLAHPSPEVRLHVLREIETHQLEKAIPLLVERLPQEDVPALRGALVRTLGTLSIEQALPWLESSAPLVRLGALVGLLKSGELEGILLAGEQLQKLIESPASQGRIMACQVLAEVANPGLYRSLQKLLKDPNTEVRQQALVAAGRLASPRLWPEVVEALLDPQLRPSACRALKGGGDSVLPFLRTSDLRCVRIAGARCTPASLDWLQSVLKQRDRRLRQLALHQLSRHNYRAPETLVDPLYALLREEEQGLRQILSALEELQAGGPELAPLVRSLDYQAEKRRQALLMILSLLFEPEVMQRVRLNLWEHRVAPASRAAALEVLDGLLPRSLKMRLLPLLELDRNHPVSLSAAQRLQQILEADCQEYSPWIVALARHLAKEERSQTMLTTVERVLTLKKVQVFSETPDEVLVEVAEALEEVDLPAGHRLFSAGEVGNRMYIVVFGKVQVHRQEEVLNQLGPGDFFGEMSLLDAEPRTASVTTLEDTRLLQLSQEILYELMADHGQVMRGIIRYLTSQLRDRWKG